MSDVVKHEPRVLLYDIETTHNKVAAFRLLNDFTLPHENILQERYIVCASWKWLGEKKVYAVSTLDDPKRFKKDFTDDFVVVSKLHDIISEADVIVGHNGDHYDLKFSETRMLKQGLSPLPPATTIDTLKVARARFMFNSNKLDYLGQFLGVGQKIHTGNDLWLRVLDGDADAIREMVVYNKQDVLLLEDVFLKLRPYMPNHINRQLFGNDHVGECPRCGSRHIQARGRRVAISNVYNQFQCQECGGWFREKTADKKVKTTLKVL